jgi:acetyl esterase/lipase
MPLIDAELLPFVDEVRAENAATTARMVESTKTFDPDGDLVTQMRSMMEPGGVFGQELVDDAQERTIPGPAGEIPVRVFVPPTVDAVYLSIHGGAFMMGSRRSSDQTNWRIAQQCNVAVVSPEYRMAPEHQYPAGHDDGEAVALWILERGAAELGSDRLLVGGESAGGHIAAVTVLRLRDRHDAAARVRGANLNCGVYDLAGTPSRTLPPPDHDVLAAAPARGREANVYFGAVTDLRDPDVSPLYADLRGLCPALFTVGTGDTLLDDSVFMATRWELAGNATELAIYPHGPHGVTGSPTEMGRRAQARVEDFIRSHAKGEHDASRQS